MTSTCTFCHSNVLVYLGRLGTFHWYRCRHCGLDQTILPEPEELR